MYEGHTIGVVVPAYNEEGHVAEVIETLPSFVDRVFVVDDGSTDGTWEEIQRQTERSNEHQRTAAVADGGGFEQRVVPIRHEENRGVGGAIKTGYLHAREEDIDVTVVVAGDGQMDPELLDRIVKPVVEGDADYAKGNRLLSRSTVDDMPPVRLVGNVALTFLTKIASGYWGIGDPQNGYTAISREALESVPVEDMYEYYGYCNDLLVTLNVHDVPVVDVSMPATYGAEESHIRYGRYIPRVSSLLARSFLRRLTAKYVVRDFHPLVLLYGLGVVGIGTWAASLLGVRSGSEDGGGGSHRFLAALVGTLGFVLAMIYDRDANEHLSEGPQFSDDDR